MTTLDVESRDFELHGLIARGLTPAEAVDYYYVQVEDWSQSDWAEERGIGQSSVSQNVKKACEKLLYGP